MPMGIVSNDEFERELHRNGVKEVITPEIIPQDQDKGRGQGNNNVPESLRKIIGETSEIEGRQEALKIARMFGISDSSVSAYAKGSTSTASYNTPNKTIADYIRNRKDRLTKKALRKLQSSLDSISPEALQKESPRNLAAIAKDMSAIVKNMEPDAPVGPVNQQNNQFIFYRPETARLEDYGEPIRVNE
jgi:predicted transcriptional regulator